MDDFPNVVILPLITANQLRQGGTSRAGFSVTIQCKSGALSSTNVSTLTAANVSMDFLVNKPAAMAAAQSLGLVTSGGLTWLLDNQYGSGTS